MFHDINLQPGVPLYLSDGFSVVRIVSPHQLHGLIHGVSCHESGNGPVTVLDVRSRDDDCEHEPEDIDDDMTLAPVDLLSPSKPPGPPLPLDLTLWLSMLPAVGFGFLPSATLT